MPERTTVPAPPPERPIRFLSGTIRAVRAPLVPAVRGLDRDGDLVIADPEATFLDRDEFLITLTGCCQATGRSATDTAFGDSGVVCRRCYRPVAAKFGEFGGESEVADPVWTQAGAEQVAGDLFATIFPDGLPDAARRQLDDIVRDAADQLAASAINHGSHFQFLMGTCTWSVDDVRAASDLR